MFRALVLCTLVACGGGDSPDPDAPPVVADTSVDTTTACATPGECPCFSNDDCPEGTRCHAASEKEVYCEPGARGTVAPGGMCTDGDDCDSALCVDGTDTMRCSRTCTDSNQCPVELPRCLGGIGICAREI